MNKVTKWLNANKLSINTSKTKFIIFESKTKNYETKINLKLNNNISSYGLLDLHRIHAAFLAAGLARGVHARGKEDELPESTQASLGAWMSRGAWI